MIEHFWTDKPRALERLRVISYGLSSYGYDLEDLSRQFKVFTKHLRYGRRPRNFDPAVDGRYCDQCRIVPPDSFALAQSVEYFRIRAMFADLPRKSTYRAAASS